MKGKKCEIANESKPLHALCKRLFFAFALWVQLPVVAQTNGYFVAFADKKATTYTIDNPSAYLSERSVLRRLRQSIAIDSTDLPVSKLYADSLRKLNLNILHLSKWMNGAIVKTADTALMDTLARLSFVKSVELTYGPFSPKVVEKFGRLVENPLKNIEAGGYGVAWSQISTVNGVALQQRGYTGHGMQIAVIDAGFYNANTLPLLEPLFQEGRVLGTFDFVDAGGDVYRADSHGMNVLSIMAGNIPNMYVGTAPDAEYWLLRSEDVYSEYPIEADNWICAAEFADSVGVDVINSSLGYGYYDNPLLTLPYAGLDGTSRVSRAANLAVKKGMVVVNSAGNEGNKSWRYVLTPADASQVIAVGAIRDDSVRVAFSSVGPTADKRIKPDIMAMGYMNAVQGVDGNIKYGNGTSFAAPVITGLVACLWQSALWLKASQLITILKESGNRSWVPDNLEGYGVPNFGSALQRVLANQPEKYRVAPNPFNDYLLVERMFAQSDLSWKIELYDLNGRMVVAKSTAGNYLYWSPVSNIGKGFFLLRVSDESTTQTFKLIKN